MTHGGIETVVAEIDVADVLDVVLPDWPLLDPVQPVPAKAAPRASNRTTFMLLAPPRWLPLFVMNLLSELITCDYG